MPVLLFLSENFNNQDQPQDSARAKKTDEDQQDHEDDAEEEIEFNENEARESPRPGSKASKADLDEPITSSSVDEEEAEDNEVSENALRSSFEQKYKSFVLHQQVDTEIAEPAEPAVSEGTRKRKPRKE